MSSPCWPSARPSIRPGLFARDLAECLALQLKARDRFDPAIAALVANLDLLARRDFVALRRICGVDEEDLVDMVAEIRALDPRPGTGFFGGFHRHDHCRCADPAGQ